MRNCRARDGSRDVGCEIGRVLKHVPVAKRAFALPGVVAEEPRLDALDVKLMAAWRRASTTTELAKPHLAYMCEHIRGSQVEPPHARAMAQSVSEFSPPFSQTSIRGLLGCAGISWGGDSTREAGRPATHWERGGGGGGGGTDVHGNRKVCSPGS